MEYQTIALDKCCTVANTPHRQPSVEGARCWYTLIFHQWGNYKTAPTLCFESVTWLTPACCQFHAANQPETDGFLGETYKVVVDELECNLLHGSRQCVLQVCIYIPSSCALYICVRANYVVTLIITTMFVKCISSSYTHLLA